MGEPTGMVLVVCPKDIFTLDPRPNPPKPEGPTILYLYDNFLVTFCKGLNIILKK